VEPVKIKAAHGPEWTIQRNFIRFLRERRWNVERMIGNSQQFGIPDIYVAHRKHGERWIDLKCATGWDLTSAQRIKWPVWESFKIGIWIITCNNDYPKLFEPPNFRDYWRARYNDIPTVSDLMEGLKDGSTPEKTED
jgi:hypothetical protein